MPSYRRRSLSYIKIPLRRPRALKVYTDLAHVYLSIFFSASSQFFWGDEYKKWFALRVGNLRTSYFVGRDGLKTIRLL
jgi:hypothetical protein